MQGRIFHRVCAIILLALLMALAINLVTQIPVVSLLLSFVFVVISILFYSSRVLGNLRSSVILFGIVLHIAFVVNFFFNSGLEGPSLILFLVSLIFIIAVMPNRQYLFWVSLNVVLVVTLICLDYFYPSMIENSYRSRMGMYTDMVFSYIAGVACIAVVLTYILRSYQRERNNTIAALEALALANESKTKLLSILSHDLKAPLNSIESFLEVLVDFELNEKEEKTIKASLLKETRNTKTMLVNMLSWTKSQMEGGIKVNLTRVNLREALKVTIEIQQVAAAEKMIRITSHIEPEAHVVADAEMINLIVRNLLNNAVKFTQPGGKIVLKGECINGHAVLSIKDNGIGISEEKQQDLFSLNTGTTYGTANEKGVGLGLKLCKEFMELQGGEISFVSVPGEGTEFTLTLPLGQSPGK